MENIFDYLNKNELLASQKGYYFEKIIFLSLSHYLKYDDKKFFSNYTIKTSKDKTIRFDALLPDGINDIDGPVLVEMKTVMNLKLFEGIAHKLNELPKESNIKTFLLILNMELTQDYNMQLESVWDKLGLPFRLVVWDINDLKRILQNNELFSADLDEIDMLFLKTESKDNNKDNLEILKGIYKTDEIILFLGSGVSKGDGLPLWNELIGSLSSKVISNLMKEELHYLEIRHLTDELSGLLKGNPLISASYIEKGILKNRSESYQVKKKKQTFYPEIKKSLYENYNGTKDENSQLYMIAKGILNSKPGKGIKKVITYNYDDVLQQYLKKIDNSFLIQTIFSDAIQKNNHFPIFHVHGFLPKKENHYNNYKIDGEEIIFTEDSYHNLQDDPYSWRNLTQVNALREDTVVMIGLSLTDPNLRRLLKQTSKRSERDHFVFLCRYSGENSGKLSELKSDITNNFLDLHHHILEETLKKLGVNVIWYDNHEEIPKILKELFGINKS